MSTTEAGPDTDVDRTKVDVAADCEANRTRYSNQRERGA